MQVHIELTISHKRFNDLIILTKKGVLKRPSILSLKYFLQPIKNTLFSLLQYLDVAQPTIFRLCWKLDSQQSTTCFTPHSQSWPWHILTKMSSQSSPTRCTFIKSTLSLFLHFYYYLCTFSIQTCITRAISPSFSTTDSSPSPPYRGLSPPWCSS